LNLFHLPDQAKQELSMKMDRQQEGLNETMTEACDVVHCRL
jgi:isopenicillin N synthase-like dioxygenase